MTITMRQMLEAGVHFGHQTRYWNPKMAPCIFGERNGIHIINLEETLPKFLEALSFVKKLAENGGKYFLSVPNGRRGISFARKPSALACLL